MFEGVQRIDEERPLELPPLSVEARPVGVLFLDDAYGDEVAGFYVGFNGFLPDRQYAAATSSPGCEMKQYYFFAAILG